MTYLAPEAVLRDEHEALASLFTALDANLVQDFDVGGQVRNPVVANLPILAHPLLHLASCSLTTLGLSSGFLS